MAQAAARRVAAREGKERWGAGGRGGGGGAGRRGRWRSRGPRAPPARVTPKDATEKLAHRRLTVLELAERLGNVAEAGRRGGVDRTSFYDWERRRQTHGG